jgi:dynein assembly factor 1, axonemal
MRRRCGVQVLDVFSNMSDLRCLYLRGNPVVSKVRNYRKTMIATIKSLTYLDDRPVFEVERRCAEAW